MIEWRTASTHPTTTAPANRNHCPAYDRCGPSDSSGSASSCGNGPASAGSEETSSTYSGHDGTGQLGGEAFDVEALDFVEVAGRGVAELAAATHLRWAQAADHVDLPGWRWGYLREIDAERHEAALDEEDASVRELQRCDEDVAGGALQ